MSQHKATLRKSLRSALTHKAVADRFIDSMAGMQSKLNATLDKLSADASAFTPAAAATASIATTTPIVLTSVAVGPARNTNTFTINVNAAAANPTNTILVSFTGTAAAISCTVTPNDGTNNSATPVNLTTANLVQLISSGIVTGKTITLADASSLRVLQTATGGDTTALADTGEGDGDIGTFASGAIAFATGLDTNYVSLGTISSPFLSDEVNSAQDKASIRRVMRSVLKHKALADTLIDSLAVLEANYNALLIKLDAEAGTLNDQNYASSLSVVALSPDAHSHGQHQASFRKTLRSALSHARLADQITDGIAASEAALNSALAKLDTANINGQMAALKVTAIIPDAQ